MTINERKNKYIQTIMNSSVGEGKRNATLIKISGTLKDIGFTDEELETILTQYNNLRCVPPVSDKELQAILEQARKYICTRPNAFEGGTYEPREIKQVFKVSVVLHDEQYQQKPKDVYKLQDGFKKQQLNKLLSLQELKVALEHGQTTNQTNGYYLFKNNGTGKETSERINLNQQVYYLDIDNDTGDILPLEQAKQIALNQEYKPFMIYESFSSTPQQPRYRLCYVFDELFDIKKNGTDLHEKIKDVINAPFEKYIDRNVTNDNRLIFGTNKSAYYFNENNVIELNKLIKTAKYPVTIKKPTNEKASFIEWLQEPIERKVIKTNIKDLDFALYGGLPIGLTQLMGESSVGKTALALNIAEEIAKTGRKVLYFTTEMDKNTLYSRGISRQSKTVPYNQIILGKAYGRLELMNAIDEYFYEISNNLVFVECFSNETKTTQYIDSIIQSHYDNDVPPVVIIDYLQQLDTINNKSNEERLKMKKVSTELLDITNKYKIAMVVLSSVAREQYGTRITLSGGKESGELEFNATCVMAIQWTLAMDTERKTKALSQSEIDMCKNNGAREVTLTVLKNRLTSGTNRLDAHFIARFNEFKFI